MPSVPRFFSAQSAVTRTSWRLMRWLPVMSVVRSAGVRKTLPARRHGSTGAGGADMRMLLRSGAVEDADAQEDATEAAADAAQVDCAASGQRPVHAAEGNRRSGRAHGERRIAGCGHGPGGQPVVETATRCRAEVAGLAADLDRAARRAQPRRGGLQRQRARGRSARVNSCPALRCSDAGSGSGARCRRAGCRAARSGPARPPARAPRSPHYLRLLAEQAGGADERGPHVSGSIVRSDLSPPSSTACSSA